MPNARQVVKAPSFVPSQYGLLSVTQNRFDVPDAHWQNGITFESVCGVAAGTFSPCVTGGSPVPHAKAPTHTTPLRGALPFAVYAEINCSPPGSWDELEGQVAAALTETEHWQVEQVFWTGAIAGAGYVVLPHLAADTLIQDEGVVMQSVATLAGSGGSYDIVEGLGRLEKALGDCYAGQGVIHVPTSLGPALAAYNLVTVRGGQLVTAKDNLVALGEGYRGTSPSGVASDITRWIYATGQVVAYRGQAITFRREVSFDRSVNTAKMIAERAYLLAWECCHLSIPITVGGVVAGSPNSAT